jgi:hypothetical protein
MMEPVLQADNMTFSIVLERTITCHIAHKKSVGIDPIS